MNSNQLKFFEVEVKNINSLNIPKIRRIVQKDVFLINSLKEKNNI